MIIITYQESKHALLSSACKVFSLLFLLLFKVDFTEAQKKQTSVAMPIYLELQDQVPSDGWSIFIDS